jgi:ribosome recycling factor
MVMSIEWLVAIVTIVAGVVTIIWFVRDVRKENGKTLKEILEVHKSSREILKSIHEDLKTIHEDFKMMREDQRKWFEKMEEGQRRGFETLAQILAKIEENTRKS